MTTRLSNVQIEQMYASERVLLNGTNSDDYAVLNSPAVKILSGVSKEITSTAKVVTTNFWHNLARSGTVNTSSDDPAQKGAVNSVSQRQLTMAVYRPNSGASVMDMVDEIKAGEALAEAARFNREILLANREDAVINALIGATSADPSRVRNISQTTGASTFNFNELNKAKGILGHKRGTLRTLLVNAEGMSAIRQKLAEDKRDVNENADGSISFGGMRVIESPYLPETKIEAGNPLIGQGDIAEGDVIATAYLVGDGVVGIGNGTPANPYEYERDAASGNGGGQGTMWDRETYALTVAGFSWATTDGVTSAADYADPANWTYKLDDKKMCPLVGFVFRIPSADVVTV